jgi:hypothetical protein
MELSAHDNLRKRYHRKKKVNTVDISGIIPVG